MDLSKNTRLSIISTCHVTRARAVIGLARNPLLCQQWTARNPLLDSVIQPRPMIVGPPSTAAIRIFVTLGL